MNLEKLRQYNMADVQLTQELYKRLQVPWYRRLWYVIRFGRNWQMKRRRREAERMLADHRKHYPHLYAWWVEVRKTHAISAQPSTEKET